MLGNAAAAAKVVLTAEDRTASAFASVQKNITGVGAAAANVSKLVAGIGAIAAVTAITGMVRKTADYADEMSKLAQRAGVTTEAVSALSYAARLADVDNNTLAKGLRELGNDAAEGGKNLKSLGISLKDAGGRAKTSDMLFSEVADVLASIEDPARRAAIAAKVFGDRIGPELIPLLAGGAAGLRDATAEAKEFGRVVSTEAGKAAEEFNDNLTRLGEAASGLAVTLATPVVSAISQVIAQFKLARQYSDSFYESLFRTGTSNPEARIASLQDKIRGLNGELKNKSLVGLPRARVEDAIASANKDIALLRAVLNPTGTGAGRGTVNPAAAVQRPRILTKEEERQQEAAARAADAEAKRQQAEAQRRFDASKKTEADFQKYLQEFDNARFAYLADKNDNLLKEKEKQEADHQEFLKGFDDARYDYIAQRNEGLLRAEEEAETKRLEVMQAANESLYNDVKGALSNAFRDTKDPIRAFGDALANVVFTRVSSSLATSIADGLLGVGGKGGGILGGGSGWLNSLFSFEGGGYTGSGARSGGLDGRGGFMAVVHPNETVVDHTRGQSAGGAPIVVTINNTIGAVASQGDVVSGMQTVRAQIMGELQRSARYGGALAQ